MFQLSRNFCEWIKSKTDMQMSVLLTGLNNAGKSTILSCIRGAPDDSMVPTVGQSKPYIRQHRSHTEMQFFDLGGGAKIRNIWKNYYGKMHGLVFVVDAADPDRIDEAKEVLHAMLSDPSSKGKPLLIFANKQDLPLAMSSSDILLSLELDKFPDTEQQVFACSALGQGTGNSGVDKKLTEGIDWMATRVQKRFAEIDSAVKESERSKKEEMMRRRAEIQKRTEARKAAEKAASEEAAREEAALASPTGGGSAAVELPPIVSSPSGNISGLNPMPGLGPGGEGSDSARTSSSTIQMDQAAGLQSPPTPAIPDMDASSP